MDLQQPPVQERYLGQRIAVGISKFLQRKFVDLLQAYVRGQVLDVGGRDYFLRVRDQLEFEHWTCLEYDRDMLLQLDDARYTCIAGDGCNMEFADDSFDAVINNNVLEHVFEPVKMITEIARVLKCGGHALFVIPQTADLHMAPGHYQNFTRYWIMEAMKRAGLQIVEFHPVGGVWRTIASRSALFFWHAFRIDGFHVKETKRPWQFYALFPFMAIYALVNVPVCLLLSWGDLVEEATGHIVVVSKPLTA